MSEDFLRLLVESGLRGNIAQPGGASVAWGKRWALALDRGTRDFPLASAASHRA